MSRRRLVDSSDCDMECDGCQDDDYPASLMMSQQRDRQKYPGNPKISLDHHGLIKNHGAQNYASICDE
jgi:hypothetical protein